MVWKNRALFLNLVIDFKSIPECLKLSIIKQAFVDV